MICLGREQASSIIRMLGTNTKLGEMFSCFCLGQYFKASGTELREASIAPEVIVFALPHYHGLATRALSSLPCQLGRIDELLQKTSLVRTCLRFVYLMNSLVPAANLFVVEKAALAGCEVIVARDLLATAPAEVHIAVPTSNLAAALRLFNSHLASGTIFRSLRQVAKCQKLCTGRSGLRTSACCTSFKSLHPVICGGALDARVVRRSAATAKYEVAHFTAGHMILILYARYSLTVTFQVTAWTVHHVLHSV